MASSSDLGSGSLSVRPFNKQVVLNRFDCGELPIDRWLKNKAKKSCDRHEHRVFFAYAGENPFPIGYYALQLGSESVDALDEKPSNYLQKNYTAFPSVHLAYLGVHSQYQRQGIGSFLLGDVFDRVYQISEHAGLYALTLQSISEHSTKFYEKLGFRAYTKSSTPKMLIPIQAIRDIVENVPQK